MSRGHHIDHVPEIPLVVADSAIDPIKKTKEAVALLKSIKAHEDVYKSKNSRKIRSGKGKARNRRRVQLKGPLVIHSRAKSGKLAKAFRNISGVDLANVRQLDLLQLAPGGHLGRFIIWTESAFKQLDKVFGTWKKDSEQKLGYRLPRAVMHNADLDRIINSDEIQSIIRPKRRPPFITHRKNPLRNIGAMIKLNPWSMEVKRRNLIRMQKAKVAEKKKLKPKPRATKRFLELLLSPAVAPPRSDAEMPPKF
jgi:large subunit ribosomal protein L4e